MKNNIGPDESGPQSDEQTVKEAQALMRAVQERVNALTAKGVRVIDTRAFLHDIVNIVVDEIDAYAERKGLDRRKQSYGTMCAAVMEHVLGALTRTDPLEELMSTLEQLGVDVTVVKVSKPPHE